MTNETREKQIAKKLYKKVVATNLSKWKRGQDEKEDFCLDLKDIRITLARIQGDCDGDPGHFSFSAKYGEDLKIDLTDESRGRERDLYFEVESYVARKEHRDFTSSKNSQLAKLEKALETI